MLGTSAQIIIFIYYVHCKIVAQLDLIYMFQYLTDQSINGAKLILLLEISF